jgi:DNA uptake protein ComE-like DNA-binding protein
VQTRFIFAALVISFVAAAVAAELCAPLAATPQTAPAAQHAIPPPEARIDINHASIDELMKVPFQALSHQAGSRGPRRTDR